MVSGPFEKVDVGGGRSADLFLLRFDTDGSLISPEAAAGVLDAVAASTDVFFFSHGWNNTFDVAAGNYRQFIQGYAAQGSGPGATNRPMLVGVVWPAASFTMPWEDGPVIAGTSEDAKREAGVRQAADESLDPERSQRLNDLLARPDGLEPAEAQEAAGLMLSFLPDVDPEEGARPPTPEEVLAAWAQLDGESAPAPPDPDDFGDLTSEPQRPSPKSPEAAGFLSKLDPRNLLRMGTVWLMKDRAGKVGAHGVSPLVVRILQNPDVRLHLIGHSFGARVVLSAAAFAPLPRKLASMLLLQPAVNRWCFAGDVVGTGRAGGYQPVVDRVELPILSSMSSHDFPLRQAFHLALRGSNLGEPNIAAIGNTDRYGALGGYGPAGVQAVSQPVRRPGVRYDLDGGSRIIPIDGSGDIDGVPAIGGHGDINNPRTWWALRCLVHPDEA
jgi:hypothetical protein